MNTKQVRFNESSPTIMNQSSIRKDDLSLHNGQSTVLKLEDFESSDESEQDYGSLKEFDEGHKLMRKKLILPLYFDLFTDGTFTERSYDKMKERGWLIFKLDFKKYDKFEKGLKNY